MRFLSVTPGSVIAVLCNNDLVNFDAYRRTLAQMSGAGVEIRVDGLKKSFGRQVIGCARSPAAMRRPGDWLNAHGVEPPPGSFIDDEGRNWLTGWDRLVARG